MSSKNKSKPKRLWIDVDEDLEKELRDLAAKEDRSQANMNRILVQEALANRKNAANLVVGQVFIGQVLSLLKHLTISQLLKIATTCLKTIEDRQVLEITEGSAVQQIEQLTPEALEILARESLVVPEALKEIQGGREPNDHEIIKLARIFNIEFEELKQQFSNARKRDRAIYREVR